MIDPTEVTGFWRAAGAQAWFRRDAAFDAELRVRFLDAHMTAARRELDHWLETSDGALGWLLLLDQVPRNIFRDTAHQFATDPIARRGADKAIAAGHDKVVTPDLVAFFYLPFEHSERGEDQRRSVALFEAAGAADNIRWARVHAEIIERFGRFPHRNAALGRETTVAEAAFLKEGGFAG